MYQQLGIAIGEPNGATVPIKTTDLPADTPILIAGPTGEPTVVPAAALGWSKVIGTTPTSAFSRGVLAGAAAVALYHMLKKGRS